MENNKLTEVMIEQIRAAVCTPATASISVEHVKALLYEYDRVEMTLHELQATVEDERLEAMEER